MAEIYEDKWEFSLIHYKYQKQLSADGYISSLKVFPDFWTGFGVSMTQQLHCYQYLNQLA